MEKFNPSVKETEHLVSRFINKKHKDGTLNDDQLMRIQNRTWDIAEMMFRINEVDDDLVFGEVALMCIYKLTGER